MYVPEFTLSASRCSRLHLNAVAKRVLPEHTRDALFQLFCDARTNTPKDQVFFMRHAEALKPHTFTGWLVRRREPSPDLKGHFVKFYEVFRALQAMLAALLYSASGFALFSVGALGLMATVAFTSIFFAVIGGEIPNPDLYSIVLFLVCFFYTVDHIVVSCCRHHICNLCGGGSHHTFSCQHWTGSSCKWRRNHCCSRYATLRFLS